MVTQVQNNPVYQLPFLYINGLNVSNNANFPATKLDVAFGQCRDSNDIMDICLGPTVPNIEGGISPAPITIDSDINGVNGLDIGSLASDTVYAVYMIGDSRYLKTVASILTLASNATPLMPFGYDSYRLTGYAVTGSEGGFYNFFVAGNNNYRLFIYDNPVIILEGTDTSPTPIDLSTLVPPVDNTPVYFRSRIIPDAANDSLEMGPGNGNGTSSFVFGQSAMVPVEQQVIVFSQLVSGVPTVNYNINSGGTALIFVYGFNFFI